MRKRLCTGSKSELYCLPTRNFTIMFSKGILQMNHMILVVITFLSLIQCNVGYNILAVFPSPSISHQLSCQGVTRALAEKGHNVTVITANPGLFDPLKNYREIDISGIYDTFIGFQKKHSFSLQAKLSPFIVLPKLAKFSALVMESTFKYENVQQLLRSNNTEWDLIIYEGLYPSALGLVHHFNYPPSVIYFTVTKHLRVHYQMGNPVIPSYMSFPIAGFSDKMNFFERLQNVLFGLFDFYVAIYHVYPMHDSILKRYFGENIPSTKDLERNSNLMLISGDLSQDYPMPLQPNTIQVGAMHIRKQKPLPSDIKEWLDESDEGVIYFSLGSNMKATSVSEDKRNSFAKAFAQFPRFRVIWKWESDVEFPEKSNNTLLKKWIPQQALLAHPKLRLFITQGGHQSRQEAIHYAVPTITIPMFWDQEWNAKQAENMGFGLTLSFYEITYETVYESLKTMLTNDSFKNNAKRASAISRDKPMSNADTAVWWIEYVIRHKGAPHMRPAVQNLYWFQYLLLDVIAFVLLSLFISSYFIYYSIKKLLKSKSKLIKLKKY